MSCGWMWMRTTGCALSALGTSINTPSKSKTGAKTKTGSTCTPSTTASRRRAFRSAHRAAAPTTRTCRWKCESSFVLLVLVLVLLARWALSCLGLPTAGARDGGTLHNVRLPHPRVSTLVVWGSRLLLRYLSRYLSHFVKPTPYPFVFISISPFIFASGCYLGLGLGLGLSCAVHPPAPWRWRWRWQWRRALPRWLAFLPLLPEALPGGSTAWVGERCKSATIAATRLAPIFHFSPFPASHLLASPLLSISPSSLYLYP